MIWTLEDDSGMKVLLHPLHKAGVNNIQQQLDFSITLYTKQLYIYSVCLKISTHIRHILLRFESKHDFISDLTYVVIILSSNSQS